MAESRKIEMKTVKDYSLIMKKGNNSAVGLLENFGFAVRELPWPATKIKDIAVRDWPGEHGEDAYIPNELKVEAYDMEIGMVYKGNPDTAKSAWVRLRDYLTGIDGGGAELTIYDPYHKIGRSKVWLISIDDADFMRSNIDEILPVKVTLRIGDPVTDIIIAY